MITRICFYLSLLLVGITLWSCVDVPSQGQLPPDYHALARFINVATDTTSGAVTVDGSSVGSLNFGQASGYADVLAGGRNLHYAGTTQHVSFRSNSQNSVLIYSLSGSNRFLNIDEGYTFTNNFTANGGVAGSALVSLVNVAAGSAPKIGFYADSSTGTLIKGSVAFATAPGYSQVNAASYTFVAVSDGGYLATVDGSQESPAVTTNSTGTGTFDLNVQTGLTYSITLKSDVADSFYTAGNFQFGAAGVSGAIAQAIDVSAQSITFPAPTLAGDNEVPPVSTLATGAGTFTLTRDGLAYSISITRDTSGRAFLSGDFRNAAAGANGLIVRTLSGPVGDTTLSGTWTSSDGQPLTAALITELLAGRIYMNFYSTAFPLGEVRAQLVPDQLITNVFSGSWADISSDAKDSIDTGSMYVNFTSARNPGGRIRGQIVVDPAKGHYGVSAPFATTFEANKMYTLVATGVSKTLGLQVFSDRQLGVAKSGTSGGAGLQSSSTKK